MHSISDLDPAIKSILTSFDDFIFLLNIEGEIVFGALLGAYIVDIVFYGENNIGIVCVVIIVGLFRWLRSMDE